MQKYSSTVVLPSCAVNMALLGKLEDYILKTRAEVIQNSGAKTAYELFEVDVADSAGVHTVSRVAEYGFDTFPDDVSVIRMECQWSASSRSLSINIRFENDNADVRIKYEGDGSREFVHGRCAEIREIIDRFKNLNRLYHPSRVIDGLLDLLSSLLLAAGVVLLIGRFSVSFGVPALSSALAIYTYNFIGRLKPYSAFDTVKNHRNEQVSTWFILGFFAFLLWGVLGRFVTKTFLGF